ncbi:hypothetical protein AVEN_185426-1 [Araneus ventricosus]|uniref:Uncharacterized protein n=1 Tax=Araneus ventricosus TaxID=182803 RepID=A0A4Y2CHU6_ARAVE|nr:hypothetical protein AVEN_185426-1 [Araneus ventricosus]
MEKVASFSNSPKNTKHSNRNNSTRTNEQYNRQQITNNKNNSTLNTARRLLWIKLQREIPKASAFQRRSQLINTFEVQRRFNTFQVDQSLPCDPSTALFIVSSTGRATTWNHLEQSG